MKYFLHVLKNLWIGVCFLLCSAIVNGQPVITSFSPVSGTAGTTVIISGLNFSTTVSNNIVLFNTIRATVSSASATILTVIVPAGAIYGNIVVISNGLITYSATPFTIAYTDCPNLNPRSFSAKTDFPAASNLQNICSGDLDLDGYPDIVTANGTTNSISIFRNNGTGYISFAPRVDIVTSPYPVHVMLSDLDADGRIDIIVANSFSSSVSVFRNTSIAGALSFAPKIDFTTGSSPIDITAVDLDKNGKTDLVIANSNTTSFSVLSNTGSAGIISFAAKIDFSTGTLRPRAISSSDFDNDGKTDIVVASASAVHDSVSIFRNTSTATISFSPKINLLNDGGAYAITTPDIDLDGYKDIVVSNFNLQLVSVFRNSAGASIAFQPKTDFGPGIYPQRLDNSDFNGDGKPDIICSNTASSTVSVLVNNSSSGNISFYAAANYAVGQSPSGISVADFDLNGLADITTCNQVGQTITVLKKASSQKVFLVDSSKVSNITAVGVCNVSTGDWTNACNNLQTAINAASDGDEIWVSKGNYFPNQDSLGNTNPAVKEMRTFVMKSGVKVYGGFSGIEINLDQANNFLNKTILNGQVDDNGILKNVGNVVWFGHLENSIMHGFIVTNGKAVNGFQGGGIHISAASPIISNCIITANISSAAGGGLYINNANPTLINCSIYGNTAQSGAGIANLNASPKVINCTVVKNNAANVGGGIYNQHSTAVIANSIIWANRGSNNIYDDINSITGDPVVSHSYVGVTAAVFPGTGNRNNNPMFTDAANDDFSLIKFSNAVTGGNILSYPSYAPSTDLAGNPRISNGISCGAYQNGKNTLLNFNAVIYVDSSANNSGNGNSWATAYSTVSDGLMVSNLDSLVKAVWVSKGTYTPVYDNTFKPNPSPLSKVTFAVKRRTKLYGGFAGNETDLGQRNISANQTILNGFFTDALGSQYRAESVIKVTNNDSLNSIDGFTVMNGYGSYTYGGGGISMTSARMTVSNCRFINNLGSAIENIFGRLSVTNCYFSGNDALYGAGINNTSSLGADISDCDFVNNVVEGNSNSYGGGISNSNNTNAIITISRCNFINNRTINDGGAIHNSSSTVIVKNCKFTGNHSGSGGAVAILPFGGTSFLNCTFIKNSAGSGGAISNISAVSSITNCSITNNSASYYGGVLNGEYSQIPAQVTIRNSIIWGNTSLLDHRGDNIFYNNDNNPVSTKYIINNSIIGLQSGIYPGAGNMNADPRFIDTANGITKLLYNSPAIETGDNNSYTGNINNDRDIDGMYRLSGAKIDMGSSEFGTAACPGGTVSITSNITGSAYQWQVDNGSGFTDLTDNTNITGSNTLNLQLANISSGWNGYKLRCNVNAIFSNTSTIRIYNQWLGTINKSWENPLNWSCNILPDGNTNVLVNDGEIEINSNALCYSLLLNAKSKITINPAGFLTITH